MEKVWVSPIVFALLLPSLTFAQVESNPAGPVQEQNQDYETVVSASRSNEALGAAGRQVHAVSDQQIYDQQSANVIESITEAPGVHMQQTNVGAGSPILRGLVGPQNLIVLDGLRFNTSTFRTGPNQYLNTLSLLGLEKIEILHGPSGTLFGQGAMGGLIHLITENPKLADGLKLRSQIAVSTADGTRHGDVRGHYGARDWALNLGGAFQQRGELRAGHGRIQPASDYQGASWFLKGRKLLGKSMALTTTYRGSMIDGAGRTDRLGQGDIRFYDNFDHFAYLRLGWAGSNASLLKSARLSLSWHHTNEKIRRFSCNQSEGIVDDIVGCAVRSEFAVNRRRVYHDKVHVVGIEAQTHLAMLKLDKSPLNGVKHRLKLTLGAEANFDRITSNLMDGRLSENYAMREKRGNLSDGSSYRTMGAFAQGKFLLMQPFARAGLFLHAGGRVSNFGAFAEEVPGIGTVDYDHLGLSGSGGLQLRVADVLNIYLNYDQGFRAPNLQETTVLGDTGSKFEIPNDNLGPERSATAEFGIRGSYDRLFEYDLTLFRADITGMIDEEDATYNGESEFEGKPVKRRINSEQARFMGFTAELKLHWSDFTLKGHGMWTKGDVTHTEGEQTPARRVPPLQGQVGLRYNLISETYKPKNNKPRGFVEFFAQMAARQDRLHPSDERDLRICETQLHTGVLEQNCQGTRGFYTLNLRGGWEFDENIGFRVGVYNLLDRRYRRHGSGYQAAGIDGRLSIELRM